MKSLAPIVLFAYNRPTHTKKTLDALALNELASESNLFIYIDGYKSDAKPIEINRINKVKSITQAESRFKSVTIRASVMNKGLAASIINGVSEVVNQYGRIIVLEDDLVTSPFFLRFMNQALDLYHEEEDVACISGYIYPVKEALPETFFIKGADCWGWATWKRSWEIFEEDGSLLLAKLKERSLLNDFNFNNSYPYYKMLEDQITGKNNSWAVRWYASAFLKEKLTLYPSKSFVKNIGFDGTGIHSGKKNFWDSKDLHQGLSLTKIKVEENKNAKTIIGNYFRTIQKKSLFANVKNAVKRLFG